MPKPIFVAATRQHVGKTTVSLALMSGLQKRFEKVGFIKPVGQQHIPVMNSQGKEIRVDKDTQVMKEFFSLGHIEYADMSPVIIPKGYTSRYIDSEINSDAQVEAIRRSFAAQSAASDVVLVEGTGHVGVGSIVELSNAKAAALVGADVVLVTNGGLGKAFDELEMNRQMFANEGVKVRGVVLNKVMPQKVAQVREKMGKVMMERWGVPLLGVVSDLPYLGYSSLRDIEHALEGNLHLVFSQGFRTPEEVKRFQDMMDEMCYIVAVKHKGSLKGEHGTGRNMAPYVEMEWGPKANALMWKIKRVFDPQNILNPGVVS